MITVNLWDAGPCVIVEKKTGVIYTNQVDGTACRHPRLEGVLVPLDKNDEEGLLGECPSVEQIKSWFEKKRYLPFPLKFLWKQWMLEGCPEAWIPVEILPMEKDMVEFSPFKDLVGKKGRLTYENSD